MSAAHHLWRCRHCEIQQTDNRTPEARHSGLSLKCRWCGGICDPSHEAIRQRDLARSRNDVLSPRPIRGVEIVIAWDCWQQDCVTPPVIPSYHCD